MGTSKWGFSNRQGNGIKQGRESSRDEEQNQAEEIGKDKPAVASEGIN